MESGADSYLHKKFKKQLSIEQPRRHANSNDKENRSTARDDRPPEDGDDAVASADNNDPVPNQSTNRNADNSSPKSSISLENQRSANNPCISSADGDHYKPASFDTNFSAGAAPSSILDSLYAKQDAQFLYDDYPAAADAKGEEAQVRAPAATERAAEAHPGAHQRAAVPVHQLRLQLQDALEPVQALQIANARQPADGEQDSGARQGDLRRPVAEGHSPDHLEGKEERVQPADLKLKPYKPRFHTGKQFFETVAKENIEEERQSRHPASDLLSHHINEIINKNNSIVNSGEPNVAKKRFADSIVDSVNNNEYMQKYGRSDALYPTDEPLNLTNKNRKRCMSEIAEPVVQKSLIKELLLKNLYSNDMQCPYCKMIFQTVTELDVHKYRNCKGKPSGVRYSRSSSVNVASILTQNKNAFDNIPQLQNTIFPLNSPGPFLGKTRLVETDKTKSFSFDSGNLPLMSPGEPPQNYLLSPLPFDKEKRPPVKLFGGEVKIHSSGETKSFKIDNKDDKYESESNYIEYGGKLSENRVIQSSLQSGGTVLTNKTSYNKQDLRAPQDVIRVYENTSVSPSIDIPSLSKPKFTFDCQLDRPQEDANEPNDSSKVQSPLYKYTNIMDFSQKAVKMLTPNLKQPNFTVPGIPVPSKMLFNNLPVESKPELSSKPKLVEPEAKPQNLTVASDIDSTSARNNSLKTQILQRKMYYESQATTPTTSIYNPVNLLVNGKVIRYVPGMPGPVAAEGPVDLGYAGGIVAVGRPSQTTPDKPESPKLSRSNNFLVPEKVERPNRSPKLDALEVKTDFAVARVSEAKSPVKTIEMKYPDGVSAAETKKFARPNSLALKPTTASLKQHHGLTPTMFNQILISPDTPRVAKKYAEHFLHGNYFSYLGLKSSTKPVYCTLNKTQPFYVPHFKKLSMYSEWRQQDTKTDKLYVCNYDSRQKSQRYTVAGKTAANLIIHSSYKFIVSEVTSAKVEKGDDQQKNNTVLGGYECNEDYTYIRGRGRGRYVCDQCGIRCKKPSMLKKHIRTHSNDRPYTCSHCNFSFKTKGNLTKHMKSKAHTKNYTASSGSSSSTQQSATQSSESDTDDSGMDSSDAVDATAGTRGRLRPALPVAKAHPDQLDAFSVRPGAAEKQQSPCRATTSS
ncbi:hypothetical protein NQ318_017532 [Aromia moschata]|uniref:C2H2-type domain-containing protein n=1 Tax=Aromia moschata TaxID=1265417 RepID=A0AAV8Z1D0_9CUCU|nr:hypothetical protein NQ318_017532 [Aromia moschata]